MRLSLEKDEKSCRKEVQADWKMLAFVSPRRRINCKYKGVWDGMKQGRAGQDRSGEIRKGKVEARPTTTGHRCRWCPAGAGADEVEISDRVGGAEEETHNARMRRE
jgi:hypothetical protein